MTILWTSNRGKASQKQLTYEYVARVSFCASQASPCYLAYARRGWSEVTLTATYPSPSLTGRTFPNPGWHLPTNIRITPQIFPLPYYGGGHASVNCHAWTAFRYIAGGFLVARWGEGRDRWWQKSANPWLKLIDSQTFKLTVITRFTCSIAQLSNWHFHEVSFSNGNFFSSCT